MRSQDPEEHLPRVAAVVLTYCEEEEAIACVRSLLESTYPELAILLVDNGSPDGSGERLHDRFPDLESFQTGSNLGYAGGNNRGIREALARGADYVLVLNADTTVEPDAVGHLVAAAESGDRVGGVGPKILYGARPERIWYAGGRFSALHGLGLPRGEGEIDPRTNEEPIEERIEEVTFITGCAFFLSARAVREVGSFADDFFIYAEDAELSVRLGRAGYRLLYQPEARVLHWTEPEESERTPFQIRMRDRNRRRLMRRNFSLPRRIPFLLRFYATRAIHLARYLFQADTERAGAIVRGMTER